MLAFHPLFFRFPSRRSLNFALLFMPHSYILLIADSDPVRIKRTEMSFYVHEVDLTC